MNFVIAVDVMGGDYGPSVTLPAVQMFLDSTPGAVCHLYGSADLIHSWFLKLPKKTQEKIQIFHCPEFIDNHTSPKDALRKFKQSSMRLAIESVKNGLAHAVISAGNTGALMALSKVILSMLPEIDRPAIAKAIPSFDLSKPNKFTVMLDLGANAQCTPKNLFDFSILGLGLYKCIAPDQESYSIKLLNIGTEKSKGNDLVQESAELLSASQLPFEGFIEPHDLYQNVCDVIVCDGFNGNVALKTTEGVAHLMMSKIKSALTETVPSKIGALLLKDPLKKHLGMFNPSLHNGGCILGLQGIVIKSHGGANKEGFYNALKFAYQQTSQHLLEKIRSQLANLSLKD
jgi:glycerol-3-phosphate acyltransferase PlsX